MRFERRGGGEMVLYLLMQGEELGDLGGEGLDVIGTGSGDLEKENRKKEEDGCCCGEV